MKKLKFLPIIIILAIISVVTLSFGVGCTTTNTTSQGYTIILESNGGTTYSTIETKDNTQEIILPTPEKPGYVFEGWCLDAELTNLLQEENYLPTQDITLYAKWSPFEYTVNFVSNGGTVYNSVFASGQYVSLPVPQKANCSFMGWYENSDFSGQAVSGNYMATTQEVTLYAKWQTITTYTISFNSNGATLHEDLKDDGNGVTLPTPIKYGYDFTGWYTNANCTGQAYLTTYFATENTTLYAGWKEVVYLYKYIADTNDYERVSYNPGTTINVADLEIPENIMVNGVECEFDYWADEELNELTTITLDTHTDIFAIYDETNAPVKDNFILNSDGSYTSTYRNGVKVFVDEGKQQGAYSIDITFIKGAKGGLNATFRMKLSGQDYPYTEAGTEYLSAGFFPENGAMQIYRVRDGVLTNFIQRIYLEEMPTSWKEKFNGAITGELVTMNFTIIDFGDSFEVYVDGEKIYSWNDATVIADFVGTGFGVRSSSPASIFANAKYSEFKTITLQANGGINVEESVKYVIGKLDAGVPLKENSKFEGWYYDQGLTNKVDLNNPIFTQDTTIYAKYTSCDVNVSLYDGETKIASYGYDSGSLYLPTLENKANRVFNGWYYDSKLTQVVDAQNPSISGSTSLYAGWRYPTPYQQTINSNQTVSVNLNYETFSLLGEQNYSYAEYVQEFSYPKGYSGSVFIAFRADVYGDGACLNGASFPHSDYLAFGLHIGNGRFGAGYVGGPNSASGYKGMVYYAFADMPSAWQTFFSGVATGETISYKLVVQDYGSSVKAYFFWGTNYSESALIYECTNTDILNEFTGKGYGIYTTKLSVTDTSSSITFKYPTVSEQTQVYNLNLVNGSNNDTYVYIEGANLPTLTTTEPNKVFNGWYYDSAFTQPVDLENHSFATNNTLYASWRYPTPYEQTVNSNKTVSVNLGTSSFSLLGEENYTYAEYTQEFSYPKGYSGSVFIAFRADAYGDGACANGASVPHSDYLAFGLHIGAGRFGAGYVGGPNTGSGYTKIVYHTFANMPSAWQTFFNGVATGETISYKLVVQDYGSSVKAYFFWGTNYSESALVYECTDTTILNAFTGKGYGIYTTALSVTDSSTSITFNNPTVKELTETSNVLTKNINTEVIIVKKNEEGEVA